MFIRQEASILAHVSLPVIGLALPSLLLARPLRSSIAFPTVVRLVLMGKKLRGVRVILTRRRHGHGEF